MKSSTGLPLDTLLNLVDSIHQREPQIELDFVEQVGRDAYCAMLTDWSVGRGFTIDCPLCWPAYRAQREQDIRFAHKYGRAA